MKKFVDIQIILIINLKKIKVWMESNNINYINNGSAKPISGSDKIHCSICKQQFDDMAKMQRHAMVEHMNKGEMFEDL